MSSSDDDIPLSSKGRMNGTAVSALSKEKITKDVDTAMGDALPSNGHIEPGVSVRNGPMEEMDVDMNGTSNGKRKSRGSLGKTVSYAEADSSGEDDKPLIKRRRKAASDSEDEPLVTKNGRKASMSKRPPKATAADFGDSDSDVPLHKKLVDEKTKIEKKAEKEAKAIRKEEAKPAKKAAPVKNGKKTNGLKPESSDEDVPLSKKAKAKPAAPTKNGKTAATTKAKGKAAAATPVKGKGKVKKEETEEPEEDDEPRWWDNPMKEDHSKKWTTLEHNGVVFPPPYEPLPKNIKLKYDGIPVTLHPDAEEVAGFFGGMLNSTHNVENPTFQKNFFQDFQAILKKTGGAKDKHGNAVAIKEFAKCDFKTIFEYYDTQREEKKALPAAEKKKLKAEKDEAEAQYMHCIWDGRKQKVGNFRVEPPGLFRGRGEHPKTGRVKTRVMPEQITINIGKEAKIPSPPEGHKWKEVKHDQEGTWLAMWQENINGAYKYVMLAANSDVKGQSDYKKFEKARELKKHIDRIRANYKKELKSEIMQERQRATAVYLIDQFALRAGNEKGDDEADTVGCCSLKFEHVTLRPPNTVIFDFLGKDSIRFYDEVQVDQQVFKNLKIFKKAPKSEGDEIFDRLTTTQLNKHLSEYMSGLTAKVFRTYNASWTMASILKEMKSEGTIAEKVNDYNAANRKVAILCNHKRTVTAGHETQMEKLGDRIKGLRYQKWRLRQMMIDVDPKIKKKKGAAFFELDEDLDMEWIKEHQAFLVEEQRTKITKKFEKENEKLQAEGKPQMKQKELNARLAVAKELEDKFKKENKTKKVEAEGRGPSIEKLEASLSKLEQRIDNMTLQAEDKENNKEVALGTSKINYIDPRLTVVFSKKFNVPIEKFFSKTLREKFEWAIKSVDENWEF